MTFKKLLNTLTGIAVVATLSAPSIAAADFQAGDKELTASLSFFHQQDSDTGSITGDASFGYFLSDFWEVGLRQGLTSNLVDNGSDTYVATTTPFLRMNFNNVEDSNFIPYIGAFTGLVWNDEDVTGTVGPEAGMRFLISESAFVAIQYRYEWFFNELELDDLGDDLDQIGDNSSDGNHVATVGLGITW